MTIEKLLEKSADELEKLSYQDLKNYFEPYLKHTRPELAAKPVNTKKQIANSYQSEKNQKKAKAQDILNQLGIDLKL